MIAVMISGFILGCVGSLHCVGMCGPLALSLPVVKSSSTSRFASTLLYNLGRTVTYTSLGLIFGAIGFSFNLFGFQQGLSIAIGILLLCYLIIPSSGNNLFARFMKLVRQKMATHFFKERYSSLFSIGILNGLLPCGMIYMAIAGATSTGSITRSMFFMAFFGLGTIPLMWSFTFLGSYMNVKTALRIKKLYPYVMAACAALLIIRGLGLGIPYISPATVSAQGNAIDCHD